MDATDEYEEDEKDETSPSTAMTPLELTPRQLEVEVEASVGVGAGVGDATQEVRLSLLFHFSPLMFLSSSYFSLLLTSPYPSYFSHLLTPHSSYLPPTNVSSPSIHPPGKANISGLFHIPNSKRN